MCDPFGVHPVEETEIVHMFGHFGEKRGDMLAALTVLGEIPKWLEDVFLTDLPGSRYFKWDFLPVTFDQLRLEIESIDLAGATLHKEENHPLGPGREHRLPDCQWIVATARSICHRREGQISEATARETENISPGLKIGVRKFPHRS